MNIDINRIKRINESARNGVKLKIEKQDARKLASGTAFHAGTLTDEKGDEFDFTITEFKDNGASTLELTWCDELPFTKERMVAPYTTEASDADLRRIAIETKVLEEFTAMQPNAELED